MCVYLCGGSCIEDLSSHLLRYLSQHPLLRTCSSDTVLRIMSELSEDNVTYISDAGKNYDFNTADKLNGLLVEALLAIGQLKAGEEYDSDFDHEFLETEIIWMGKKPLRTCIACYKCKGTGKNHFPKSIKKLTASSGLRAEATRTRWP